MRVAKHVSLILSAIDGTGGLPALVYGFIRGVQGVGTGDTSVNTWQT